MAKLIRLIRWLSFAQTGYKLKCATYMCVPAGFSDPDSEIESICVVVYVVCFKRPAGERGSQGLQ